MRPLLEWTVLHCVCCQTNGQHMVSHTCAPEVVVVGFACVWRVVSGPPDSKKKKRQKTATSFSEKPSKDLFFFKKKQTHMPFTNNDIHDTSRPIKVRSGSASLNPLSPLPI